VTRGKRPATSEERRTNAEFAEGAEDAEKRDPRAHVQIRHVGHPAGKRELEAEDLEVALAGEDYGEEAAVGGEGVFTDG
jgi:hypothetical protein